MHNCIRLSDISKLLIYENWDCRDDNTFSIISIIICNTCYRNWEEIEIWLSRFLFNISIILAYPWNIWIFTIREFTIHVICKRNFFQIFKNHSTFISYFPPLHFKVRTWRTTMWWNQINGLLWQMNFSISVVYVLLLKLYFDDYHLNLTFSLCLSLKGGEESNRK